MIIAKQTLKQRGMAMRDIQILQQSLENQCPNIHKKELHL
jgi:hypothetical protein